MKLVTWIGAGLIGSVFLSMLLAQLRPDARQERVTRVDVIVVVTIIVVVVALNLLL